MCTRALWADAHHAAIVGRTMDFHMDLLTNLWKMPRGIERSDGVHGTLTWSATYGSVVANAFDLIATDGMNEAGFAGHILWLTESDYGAPTESQVQLSQSVWLQYYLDNFATVAEAVEWTRRSDVRIGQLFDPTGLLVPTLHLALNDASGDSAIIEYTDGSPAIYHSRDYAVMTNPPTFDRQLELVTQFEGLGGDQPLPGSTLTCHRLARAAYSLAHQVQPTSNLQAMAAMFSILSNVAQSFRAPEPGKPEASQTIWQVVADMTNLRYAFESTSRPNIVWVDFPKMSFAEGSPVEKLDLLGRLSPEGGLAGDCSEEFEPVADGVLGLVSAGRQALEYVARRQEAFADLAREVAASSSSRSAHSQAAP